jgi:hypothetical protein
MFQVSFLASGGLLAIFGICQVVAASLQPLLSSSHGLLALCMSMSKCPLFEKDMSHIILGLTLITSF